MNGDRQYLARIKVGYPQVIHKMWITWHVDLCRKIVWKSVFLKKTSKIMKIILD